jgi:hypothetical protein
MHANKPVVDRALQYRSKFTSDEDIVLRRLVNELGEFDWTAIASKMAGRNPRQCRDRWVGYLSPGIENGTWTTAEESLLLEKYAELGPRWMLIAAYFPSRTNINVKSRWHLIQRRVRKGVSRIVHRQLLGPAHQPTIRTETKVSEEDSLFDSKLEEAFEREFDWDAQCPTW